MDEHLHCWHKLHDVPQGSIRTVCCYCGVKGWWRGDASKEHGPHAPQYAPVVLFHRPQCTYETQSPPLTYPTGVSVPFFRNQDDE